MWYRVLISPLGRAISVACTVLTAHHSARSRARCNPRVRIGHAMSACLEQTAFLHAHGLCHLAVVHVSSHPIRAPPQAVTTSTTHAPPQSRCSDATVVCICRRVTSQSTRRSCAAHAARCLFEPPRRMRSSHAFTSTHLLMRRQMRGERRPHAPAARRHPCSADTRRSAR